MNKPPPQARGAPKQKTDTARSAFAAPCAKLGSTQNCCELRGRRSDQVGGNRSAVEESSAQPPTQDNAPNICSSLSKLAVRVSCSGSWISAWRSAVACHGTENP